MGTGRGAIAGNVETEKLDKNGVHRQISRIAKSLRAANQPTRDILPEYSVFGKSSSWKREHLRSQPERQSLHLQYLPGHFYNQKEGDLLSSLSRSKNGAVCDYLAGLWVSASSSCQGF
jgi:hypothetical protein